MLGSTPSNIHFAMVRQMFRGVAFALTACFIWGLIFVVPEFMTGFSSIEVALGRNLVYGVLSALIFCKAKAQRGGRYPRSIWKKALIFSLVSTLGYYTFLVLALRYSTPAVSALVLGISPISIAFYGNWKHKETSFKKLLIPSFLILFGLVLINVSHFSVSASPSSYILGLLCSLLSLSAWSWYVVANSRFLKDNSYVRASDWSTMIGVATLFWVFIFSLFLGLFFDNQLHIEKYFTLSTDLSRFLIGNTILGLLCSWLGAFLWNRASVYLPVSLAGQLTIFETIFGVLFVYILKQHTPPVVESAGIVILLVAIIYGIQQFAKKKPDNAKVTVH